MVNHRKYMLDMLNLISSMTTDFNFPYYHGLNVWSVATIASIALILLLFGIVSIYSIRKNAKVLKSTKYIMTFVTFISLAVWVSSFNFTMIFFLRLKHPESTRQTLILITNHRTRTTKRQSKWTKASKFFNTFTLYMICSLQCIINFIVARSERRKDMKREMKRKCHLVDQ